MTATNGEIFGRLKWRVGGYEWGRVRVGENEWGRVRGEGGVGFCGPVVGLSVAYVFPLCPSVLDTRGADGISGQILHFFPVTESTTQTHILRARMARKCRFFFFSFG